MSEGCPKCACQREKLSTGELEAKALVLEY